MILLVLYVMASLIVLGIGVALLRMVEAQGVWPYVIALIAATCWPAVAAGALTIVGVIAAVLVGCIVISLVAGVVASVIDLLASTARRVAGGPA